MSTPLKRIRRGAISLIAVVSTSIVGFRILGDYSWLEATWLVVITISTVGFSETSQSPASLQLFTIFVIMLGVTSAVYTFGGFIQLLLEGEVDRAMGRRKMTKELARMKDHVIICGFGRLGQDLAHQLLHRGIDFVVVDIDPEKQQIMAEFNAPLIVGDATTEQVLQEARLSVAKTLVTGLPGDASNVFITLTARNLRPDIQIIAKSELESSCRKLRQAGANRIVMPHRVGAQQMERMISRPSTADLFELFAEASHLEMELDELLVSDGSAMVGKTLNDLRIKEEFNLLVIGIKRGDGEFEFNPSPDQLITANETLLVIGPMNDINRMKNVNQI
ncbi:MAG: potassium channel family protein [Pirellulaceae bacterium]